MKLVCPLCNGLYKIDYNCKRCNINMVDKGPLVNYLDNYSPYLVDEVTHLVDGVTGDKCLHIYQCPACYYQEKLSIERKKI